MAHLSLLQCSLELQFLSIQLLPDLLQFMDGLVAATQLLRQVRDLLCSDEISSDLVESGGEQCGQEEYHGLTLEVLVLPFEGLQVLERLLVGVLQLEELSAEGPGLFL